MYVQYVIFAVVGPLSQNNDRLMMSRSIMAAVVALVKQPTLPMKTYL